MSYQIIRHFALFVNSTYNYVADPYAVGALFIFGIISKRVCENIRVQGVKDSRGQVKC